MEAVQIQLARYFPIAPIDSVQVQIQKKIYQSPRPAPPFIPLLFSRAPQSYKLPLSFERPHPNLLVQYPIEEKDFTFATHRLIAPLKLQAIKGQLMKDETGLHYIKLPDPIIVPLCFHLRSLGLRIPDHFDSSEDIGAHVPAILPHEIPQVMIDVSELEDSFYLFYQGIRRQTISDGTATHTYWYLTFDSPALEKLRRKYGLFSKLQGGPFYTLLGIKTVQTLSPAPTYSINPIADFTKN